MNPKPLDMTARTLGNLLLYRWNKHRGWEFLGVGRCVNTRDEGAMWLTYDKWVLNPTHYIDPQDLPLPEAKPKE